jgi:ribosomal protein S19
LFAFANVTLQALTCFCLFGRWPKIQATRAAGGRYGVRLEKRIEKPLRTRMRSIVCLPEMTGFTGKRSLTNSFEFRKVVLSPVDVL